MEKETETNERNKNWSYFKFNNILSTLRNQQWHRIICVQCSNALLFRLPISKRREWDYQWNRRKKNRITKTRTKNIHNLSWRASHFLQFNSCIMSMLVEKKTYKKAVPSPTYSNETLWQSFRSYDAATAVAAAAPLMSTTNVGNNQRHSHIYLSLLLIEPKKTLKMRSHQNLYQIHQQVFYFERKIKLHLICAAYEIKIK